MNKGLLLLSRDRTTNKPGVDDFRCNSGHGWSVMLLIVEDDIASLEVMIELLSRLVTLGRVSASSSHPIEYS
jgi:hypothetical protein